MSKLSEVTIEIVEVPVSESQSFEVRGLSFDDFTYLVHKHRQTITAIYAKFVSGELDAVNPMTMDDSSKEAITGLISQTPGFFADLVAAAADDREQSSKVSRLPLRVQLDAIQKTFAITFKSEEDVKKLMGVVTQMLENMTGVLTSLKTPETIAN